jgi:DNA-binding NarL/FixJ family response regulator
VRQLKILIAEDQKLLRDCLKFMIENNSDFEVVALASNGQEAIDLTEKNSPDVILMDIVMPNTDGVQATKIIKEKYNFAKILILTSSKDNSNVQHAIDYGADGYVLKDISSEDLIVAIKSVAAGMEIIHKDVYKIYNSTACNNTIVNGKQRVAIDGVDVYLTERELSVIQNIIDGKTNAEIAEELFLAEGRVRNIVSEIISKLDLRDRTQLAVFALKNNIAK